MCVCVFHVVRQLSSRTDFIDFETVVKYTLVVAAP